MNYLEIEKVVGREILDSRGNPTVRQRFIWLTELLQEARHHQELQQESSRHLSFVTETRADIWARVLPGQ